jgi:heme oxygenase
MTTGLDEWFAGVRRRLALLVEDLRALEVPADRLLELPRCPITAFRDRFDALGWVYVLEANTTNRRILARRIASRELPAAYLASHDRPAREVVDGVESPQDATAIVDAALDAYDRQHAWLRPDAGTRGRTNVASRR